MKDSFKLLRATFYKELKLAISPALYFFGLLSFAMMFIPNYPVWVGTFYCFIAINISFQKIVSNKDVEFSLTLPTPRRFTVIGKLFNVLYSEIIVVLFTVPGAVCAIRVMYPLFEATGISQNGGIGLDANLAFFGILFIAYGAYNIVFLPLFFKTAYKSGKPLILGMLAFLAVVTLAEVVINTVPAVKNVLDTESYASLPIRIVVLLVGIACYAGLNTVAYKLSLKTFAKVNLA